MSGLIEHQHLPRSFKDIILGIFKKSRTIHADHMSNSDFEKNFRSEMVSYEERLKGFTENIWLGPTSVVELAEAGFCFVSDTGDSDTVVCFHCKGKLSNWQVGDIAVKRHREVYPNCTFAKEYAKKVLRRKGGVQFDSVSSDVDSTEISDMNFFTSEFNRLMSFKSWLLYSPVDRYELAASGFYCVDGSPSVVCVYCFLEISEWKLGDRPKEKHKQLAPSCPFNADNREVMAIDEIQQFEKFEANLREELHKKEPGPAL